MTLLRLLPLAALAALAPAAPAAAAFGPAQPLAVPTAGPLAAALAADGSAAVAGLLPGLAPQARIELAVRRGAGGPWRIAGFGTSAPVVRDLQVAIGRAGTVVAWADARRRSQAVVVATADGAGRLTVRRRLALANGFSASPRLAVLRSGAIVLAWRDGRTSARARVRAATIDASGRVGAPRTVGTNAAQVVIAARGAGATIGWTSAHRSAPQKTRLSVRRPLPRTLTVRSLDARGLPADAAAIAGRDVGPAARLAGAPDGRLVASWLRPQKIRPYAGEDEGDAPPPAAIVPALAFTRELLPRPIAARPLGLPGQLSVGVPTVAFDGAAGAVAAVRRAAPDANAGPAFDAVLARSTAGGPWSAPQTVAHLGFSNYDPVVVAPPSGTLVVSTALLPGPGAPRWAVTASGARAPQILGAPSGSDGRRIAVARSGSGVLVAWPSTTGGVEVAEQR